MQLRQSLKGVKLAYALIFILAAGITFYWYKLYGSNAEKPPEVPLWAPLLAPAVLLLLTFIRHIRRRTTKLNVEGERIHYEAGLFAKTTRIIELAKVQDVRVDQTLSQRMVNVGDLSLETAGGSSRIVMASIDNPKAAAEHILERAKAQRGQAGPAVGPVAGPVM
jgi:membrane protein YdbS with pleckstrin-like domain